jgi:hypothetical protein
LYSRGKSTSMPPIYKKWMTNTWYSRMHKTLYSRMEEIKLCMGILIKHYSVKLWQLPPNTVYCNVLQHIIRMLGTMYAVTSNCKNQRFGGL